MYLLHINFGTHQCLIIPPFPTCIFAPITLNFADLGNTGTALVAKHQWRTSPAKSIIKMETFWVKHHGFSVEFGSNSEILKHLFEWRVLNTKTMLFSTTYHDMDNMGRSVSWMYLHLVSFADQVVQTPRATHSISGCLHVAQLSWTSTLHRCAAFQAPTKHCLVTAALHQLNSHPVALAASIFSSRGKRKWFSRSIYVY